MSNENSPESGASRDKLRAGQVSNTRAMTLYSLGVVTGLILGGIGLFNARGTTTNKVPDEVLALVNRRPILRSDFITQLENETGAPFADASKQDRLRVLDEMLREEMFVQRGLELDFAETDQDTRSALYNIVEQQVTASAALGKASEKELQDFFDKHRTQFQSEGKLDVHNLVMEDQNSDKAAEAVKALRAGTKLDEVKKRYGLSEDNYYPNEFYYLAKAHLGEKLFPAVKDLDAGQVSDPVLEEDGYHIVQVLSNTKPQQQSFEEARKEVPTLYSNSEKARVMKNMMSFLRNRSTILIADDYKDDYKPEDFESTY
jgi:parvulin-like peptidyl-prolyl isomerase